ncbi:MAG: hypothetical protein AABO41_10035 [Acidobacteriota bacterium]
MRKRLVIAAVCILALPLFFSASQTEKSSNANPFATSALAGHSTMGGWCGCGTEACICDPGEEPGGNSTTPASDPIKKSSIHGATSANAGRTTGLDFGSSALMFALAFLLWTRLRA